MEIARAYQCGKYRQCGAGRQPGAGDFYGSNELSMSIASGLIGYIGRGKLERKDDVK